MGDPIVIGIDGGGSRTRGAVAYTTGEVIAYRETGGSNPHVVGPSTAVEHIDSLVARLMRESGTAVEDIAGWCCGLAGADRPEDREAFLALARQYRCGDKLLITSDALIALAGGTLSDRGILVHAGTGSIVYGRDEKNTARVGGWGRLLDDAGSGYAIGLEALRRIMRGYDGREIDTALRDVLFTELGLADEAALVCWSGTGATADAVAALAPIVLREAENGDTVADEIVDEAADALACMVRALEKQLPITKQSVIVLSGGLLANSAYYRALVSRKLRFYYPELRVEEPKLPPVAGALLYGLNRAGVRINREVLALLEQSLCATAGGVPDTTRHSVGAQDNPEPAWSDTQAEDGDRSATRNDQPTPVPSEDEAQP